MPRRRQPPATVVSTTAHVAQMRLALDENVSLATAAKRLAARRHAQVMAKLKAKGWHA